MAPLSDILWVLRRLTWMRESRIWPIGPPGASRYLWTDGLGVSLLTSLYHATGEARHIEEAVWVVDEVDRVLGQPIGIRIGEEASRDGQYAHYLFVWLTALAALGEVLPAYRAKGIALAKAIHPRFVVPGVGVHWKMTSDLSGPYPGNEGFGGLDPYDGLCAYVLLDPAGAELGREQGQMRDLIERSYRTFSCSQELGAGMLLRAAAFFPTEPWARTLVPRLLATLDRMWHTSRGGALGYFTRFPFTQEKLAFGCYGTCIGLQAVGAWPERVAALNAFFEGFKAGDEYDDKAITWVMACNSHFPGTLLPPAVSALVRRPWVQRPEAPLWAAALDKERERGAAEGASRGGQPEQALR